MAGFLPPARLQKVQHGNLSSMPCSTVDVCVRLNACPCMVQLTAAVRFTSATRWVAPLQCSAPQSEVRCRPQQSWVKLQTVKSRQALVYSPRMYRLSRPALMLGAVRLRPSRGSAMSASMTCSKVHKVISIQRRLMPSVTCQVLRWCVDRSGSSVELCTSIWCRPASGRQRRHLTWLTAKPQPAGARPSGADALVSVQRL